MIHVGSKSIFDMMSFLIWCWEFTFQIKKYVAFFLVKKKKNKEEQYQHKLNQPQKE